MALMKIFHFVGFIQMCARDDVDYQRLQLQEVKSELSKMMKFELAEFRKESLLKNESVARQVVESMLADE